MILYLVILGPKTRVKISLFKMYCSHVLRTSDITPFEPPAKTNLPVFAVLGVQGIITLIALMT